MPEDQGVAIALAGVGKRSASTWPWTTSRFRSVREGGSHLCFVQDRDG